jgi:REP element-mobilizing transposase RayT
MTANDANRRRRSIRLPGYDYTSPGAYFVTICVHDRECLLGKVEHEQMHLSDQGRLVETAWQALPKHFPYVDLDAFVVMPNHLHGIIVLSERTRGRGEASTMTGVEAMARPAGEDSPQSSKGAMDASPLQIPSAPAPGSLGAIVGNFKSVTTRRINRMRGTPGAPFWQRNYWEHIIRDERSLMRIRQYIQYNTARWAEDQLHPDARSYRE